LLELGTEEASKVMAVETVQSHMRIFIRFLDNSNVNTSAPSEPMLAIAAADLLLQSSNAYRKAMQTLVEKLVVTGVVLEKGRMGELIARILLTLARDAAILPNFNPRKSANTKNEDEARSFVDLSTRKVQEIKLDAFLVALLGKSCGVLAEQNFVQGSRKTPQGMVQDLLKWASDCYVNFTHFIQLTEPINAVSPHFLYECWCRGVALQCASNQENYDIVIVVYSGALNAKFDESKLLMVVIQVKLRAEAAALNLVHGLTSPIIIEDDKESCCKRQYLAILMDLGTDTTFKGHSTYVLVDHRSATPNSQKKPESTDFGPVVEPKRYSLNVRGHSEARYPCISALAPKLTEIFGLYDKDKKADRPFEESLSTMMVSMNPFHDRSRRWKAIWDDKVDYGKILD
jgi:hypothetical protein